VKRAMGYMPMAGAEADTARAEPDGMRRREVKSVYESGTPHPSGWEDVSNVNGRFELFSVYGFRFGLN
jgi:hypothetical protein